MNAYEVVPGFIHIIHTNSQQGEKNEMDPAQASPLRKRYTAEHFNLFYMVESSCECMVLPVKTHLMFVMIAMAVTQCSRLLDKRKAKGADALSARLGR
jgi:hypothetical protein